LQDFDWFFVQDKNSSDLLGRFNRHNVTVSGDTRFDRVEEICGNRKDIPAIEKFMQKTDIETEKHFVLVAGSTWEKDEDLLIPFFNQHAEVKLIIAPHVIEEKRITALIDRISRPCVRISDANDEEIEKADCLIIDCFGLLSSAYRYGDLAFVGGGFGAGIHNILEAATYGIPVLFGPNYRKFKEAKELITCRGAFSVANRDEFVSRMNDLLSYAQLLQTSGKSARDYVIGNLGATHKIYEKIFPIIYTTPSTSNSYAQFSD
jgi:3-deoxy-D-manno-octulosonic-acid transferase